ncbi:PREDICTED: putative pentatricopeptide repeat-containing protein At3g15130 [Prunus mume]|uniref:Pentatricopeptide repeat-containing protein At3g15130 n=1 Tax=Prunus mume TaxID=102107 RepID=A0ABM0N5V5_PRUMU|nr:PREDICTED: putative pentatricopeptide repeat-containing protein At3g15130 [Prunus mume]
MNERQRLANLLRNCSKNLLLDQGMQAHGTVMKMGLGFDLMLSNDLIDMYSKCGRTGMACAVFDRMPERNVVSWTALMCGYLQNGNAKGSLSLFSKMGLSEVKPNEFTFSINLKASGFVGIAENGMQIHNMCTKSGFEWITVVSNSILDMYTKCGRVSEAARMFNVMPVKNLITWNAMIAGYTLEGNGERALLLFRKMQGMGEVPDEYTITSTLKACSGLGAIRQGSQIHSSLITRGFLCSVRTMIAGALVDLYVKCSHLTEAQRIFDQIEQKNLVSWSALILGYAQECNLLQAMDLFRQLRVSIQHQVDGFVLSSLMGVFADFALVEQGKQMHAFTIKIPSGLDISVTNSILDMYLKCGLTDEAEKLFNETPVRNVISWTIMITGYGKHGLGRKSIRLFHQMQSEDIEPDGVTYLAVLSACSHSGLVEECQEYFSRLCHDRRIKRNVEHYACMVDLLGRAGRLKEAKNLINSMPLKPNVGIWQTLLSACKVHGDLEIGREVGETLLRLDGDNPVNYVMLSNIYAEAGYWKECERLRKLFKMKGLKKEAGRSWVEINKEVHFFYNRDKTHPLTEKIHQKLKEMEQRIKSEIGYVHGVRFALHDVEEESKEESLRVHSEKLAIGLALVCGEVEKGHKTIRVFKNLRVCGDCHAFIKGLSKVLKVVFLVRDANRFHKFENGLCSCGDYW